MLSFWGFNAWRFIVALLIFGQCLLFKDTASDELWPEEVSKKECPLNSALVVREPYLWDVRISVEGCISHEGMIMPHSLFLELFKSAWLPWSRKAILRTTEERRTWLRTRLCKVEFHSNILSALPRVFRRAWLAISARM